MAYGVWTTFVRAAGPASWQAAVARPAPPTVFRTYTPRALLSFDGRDGAPVYLAVRGRVFDVSRGRNFYGPGGPYANFAGRNASRGLACGSFDPDVLTADLDGLADDELDALRGWEERFLEKYDVVGRLVSAADHANETAAPAKGPE